MLRYVLFYILIFFSLVILFYLTVNLKIENTIWLKEGNQYEVNKDKLRKEFNEEENLIITIETVGDFLSANSLAELDIFSAKIESLQQIKKVRTILNSAFLIEHQEIINNVSLKYALDKNIINIEEVKNLIENSFYEGILFSADFKQFNIIITPNFSGDKNYIRKNLIKQMDYLIADYNQLTNYYITGKTNLYYNLDLKNKKNLFLLSILTILFAMIYIGLLYRDLDRVIITVINSIFSLIVTLSLFVIFKLNFSLLSLCLPIIAIVVTISDTIFIFNKYNFFLQENKYFLYKVIVKKIYKPCLITSLTTAFAFLSYYFSEIKPLYDLFLVSALAIMLNLIWVIFVTPFLLIFLCAKKTITISVISIVVKKVSEFIKTQNSKILWKLCVGICLIFPGIFLINSETNFLNIFFFNSEKIVQDVKKFDQNFAGSSDLSIIFSDESKQKFKNKEFYDFLSNYIKEAKALEEVKATRSYEDITLNALDKLSANSQFQNSEELAQILLFLEFSKSDQSYDVLADYVNFDYSMQRVKLFSNNLTSTQIRELRDNLQKINIHNENIALAGTNIYFDGIIKNLIKTQFYSLLFIIVMIFCLITMIYNIRFAIIASLANIFPLVIITALASLFGVNFDFSFVLVTVICLGIGVDCSIHILNDYTHNQQKLGSHDYTSYAVSEITLFFIVCIAAFLCSDLLIFVKFAILAISTILISYLINIIFVPIAVKSLYHKNIS
jgi:uncharacterized protein